MNALFVECQWFLYHRLTNNNTEENPAETCVNNRIYMGPMNFKKTNNKFRFYIQQDTKKDE
jgi:hypothetical protein